MNRHQITRPDILAMDKYERERPERRRAMSELKKLRRLAVGPDATFYFENHDTMLHQIHEMLYIEKGGEDQIESELSAYNPLVPKGRELVATLMFEIDEPKRRQEFLGSLGGVEHAVAMSFDGETVAAAPEVDDVERTNEGGKASSVQFLHFGFSDSQVAKFRTPGAQVTLSISHEKYGHSAIIPEEIRSILAADFD